jgi:DNA-binding transcriptional MocR family regulator
VPEPIDTLEFAKKAVAENVAYVPGIHFYPNQDGGHNAMRLNFSYCSPDAIVEGIHRLGVALKKELGY